MYDFMGMDDFQKDNSSVNYEHGRQRLRPWLEAKINSGTIPGVKWLDEEKTIFTVPWKRNGTSDWTPVDAMFFEEWAVHTGRFRRGTDQIPEYATWKTRIRCAFNKAHDIEEMTQLTNLDGPNPCRVYRLLKPVSKEKSRYDPQPATIMRGSENLFPSVQSTVAVTNVPQTPMMVAGSVPVPTLLDSMHAGPTSSSLDGIPSSDLVYKNQPDLPTPPIDDILDSTGNIPMDIGDVASHGQIKSDRCDPEGCSVTHIGQTPMVQPHHLNAQPPHGHNADSCLAQLVSSATQVGCGGMPQHFELYIQTQYRSIVVGENHVESVNGCCLYHGPASFNVRQCFGATHSPLVETLYGPNEATQIQFPCTDNLCKTQNQERCTKQLLECLARGILLHCQDGDIYATRKCRCVVFFASAITKGEPIKLDREKTIKVFDFKGYINSLSDHVNAGGPKPVLDVNLGFGQRWNEGQSPSDVLITVRVRSSKADFITKMVKQSMSQGGGSMGSSLKISFSDENDRLAEHIEKMCTGKEVHVQ